MDNKKKLFLDHCLKESVWFYFDMIQLLILLVGISMSVYNYFYTGDVEKGTAIATCVTVFSAIVGAEHFFRNKIKRTA